MLSDVDIKLLESTKADVGTGRVHPMDQKKALAEELVSRFHGANAAAGARAYFETRYQKKSVPDNIRKQFSAPEPVWICRLLVDLEFAKSASEARRLIAQGAVRVDGQPIKDINFHFQSSVHKLVEVGKN